MVGLSMGRMKHWYTGTEYYIDELCIRTDRQGTGLGTLFLQEIEHAIREDGMVQIFLQTSADVPAYQFYRKNGFQELKGHVSFQKRI
jgi:aminoglycoside 6'-N-acetyltransferase I